MRAAADVHGTPPTSSLPERVGSSLGSGRPLEAGVRGEMERFFNHDFGAVRLHTDSRATRAASSLGAHAFTLGHDIAFAAGRHASGTIEGSKLLAHELTHVVQQSRGVGSELRRSKIGQPGDAYEREADSNAERFAAGSGAARVTTVGTSGSVRGGEALQFYNGGAAASYAKKWAKSVNPDFPRFSPDCTNFVSQALLAGGWKMEYSLSTSLMDGPGAAIARCAERKDDDVWWYNRPRYCAWPKVRASYSWAGAENLYNFMSTSGRGTAAGHVADLGVGDVLQYDNGGGSINHSMVVTERTKDNLFLSYHSTDTLNKPFWGPGGLLEGHTNTSFYAWQL
jgi:hypothetical protein